MSNTHVDRLYYIGHHRRMGLQNHLLPSKLTAQVAKMVFSDVAEPLPTLAAEVELMQDV